MRFSTRFQIISLVFLVSFVLWLIGLTLGSGGWIWVFFIVWLPALVVGALALWGARR